MAEALYLPYPSIEAVFEAVVRHEVERGLVPIENVIQGPVTETLDNLYRYAAHLKLVDMLVLPIQHTLGVLSPATQIKRVLSKDQALKQCSAYLQAHYPQAQQVEMASTSSPWKPSSPNACTMRRRLAVLWPSSSTACTFWPSDIGNVQRNKTRFAVLGTAAEVYHAPTGNDATALVIYPHRDRIGLLEDILTVLSKSYGLNLSSIHSRPDTRGAFRFYMEVEGHLEDPSVAACMAALTKQLGDEEVEVKIFGTYPRCAFNEPRLRTIGIIGGTGQMGGWFDTFFSAAGYTVLLSGRRTPLTYQQCIEQSDVVIINVTHQTHGGRHPCRREVSSGRAQLIATTRLSRRNRSRPCSQAVPPGVEVLGMHTVFGPAVDTLRHQNVIFTRTPASGELAREFEEHFL